MTCTLVDSLVVVVVLVCFILHIAVMSNESFWFEPYLSTTYGDCGAILHFNPNTSVHPPKPYFLNAEWVLENLGAVGHGKSTLQ